jgi:hypothetical protein
VALLQHPGHDPDLLAVARPLDLELLDVEPQLVEPPGPLLDAVPLAGVDDLGPGQLVPQVGVAALQVGAR